MSQLEQHRVTFSEQFNRTANAFAQLGGHTYNLLHNANRNHILETLDAELTALYEAGLAFDNAQSTDKVTPAEPEKDDKTLKLEQENTELKQKLAQLEAGNKAPGESKQAEFTREQLEQELTKLGISFKGNEKDETLLKKLEKAQAQTNKEKE